MCPAAPSNSNAENQPPKTSEAVTEAGKAKTALSSSMTSSMNLQTCTPQQLATHVLNERFHGDVTKTVAFLQQAQEAVAKSKTTAPKASTSVDLGKALLETPLETSLLTPRAGRVSIQFYERGLIATHLKTPELQLVLPASDVSHLLLFAKPEDYKELLKSNSKKAVNPHLVLITTKTDSKVKFKGKPVSQVCFALSWVKGVGPTEPALSTQAMDEMQPQMSSLPTTEGWARSTLLWKTVLEQSLENSALVSTQVSTSQSSQSSPFWSFQPPDQSTTTGNLPHVKCYHGVQDGVLYPLQEGLLFYKPPKFVPRSALHSIACGRGSSSNSSSRYVDLLVELNASETMEFSNIQREELGVLNDYIHKVLIPAMEKDAQGNDEDPGEESPSEPSDAEDTDEDEEDDGDANYMEGQEEDDEEEEGDSDEEDLEEDENDDFEVVEDDFAKELLKSKGPDENAPRASRSQARKRTRDDDDEEMVQVVAEDEDSSIGGDDDFEVVQVVEDDDEDEDAEDQDRSPFKKMRP